MKRTMRCQDFRRGKKCDEAHLENTVEEHDAATGEKVVHQIIILRYVRQT
jgi:hypothetical protein